MPNYPNKMLSEINCVITLIIKSLTSCCNSVIFKSLVVLLNPLLVVLNSVIIKYPGIIKYSCNKMLKNSVTSNNYKLVYIHNCNYKVIKNMSYNL